MNEHIVLGLFALYVAATSLYLVLVGRQDAVLSLLRRIWGRTRGHSLYFVANVALPLLVCVLCLGWGARNYDSDSALDGLEKPLQLNLDSYRELRPLWQKERSPDPLGAVYGA